MLTGLLGNFKRGTKLFQYSKQCAIYKSSHIDVLYLHLDYIRNLNSRGRRNSKDERDNKGDVSSKRLHCLFIL